MGVECVMGVGAASTTWAVMFAGVEGRSRGDVRCRALPSRVLRCSGSLVLLRQGGRWWFWWDGGGGV